MRTRYPTIALDGDFTVHTEVGYVESGDEFTDAGETVAGAVFIAAMRVLASGVVLVTARVDGRPWGLTISSCCSLSLDPPQLLVSLRSTSISCRQILKTGRFGVSILSTEQKPLAELGAAVGETKFMDEFCDADGCEPFESPIIGDALFHLDCAVADSHGAGDHQIIVGVVKHVLETQPGSRRDPLLYYDRSFWTLGQRLE